MGDGNFTEQLENEIDLARALTALLLAVRLDVAERRAEDVYERIIGGEPSGAERRSA